MLGTFSPTKAIQAAAVALKATQPHRMSRLRLLKLLYIADRESIAETERSITADVAYAMNHGPVLSRIYNCIKGTDPATGEWEHFIGRDGPQDVRLVEDPGIGELSQWEVEKLHAVTVRNEPLNDYELAELTHEFLEWKKNEPPKGGSIEDLGFDDGEFGEFQ